MKGWMIVGGFLMALMISLPVIAQIAPGGGKQSDDVKASDLPTGDFGLDDVEELPLPTEEEGGVQVEGKNYLPQPGAQPKSGPAPTPKPAPIQAKPSTPPQPFTPPPSGDEPIPAEVEPDLQATETPTPTEETPTPVQPTTPAPRLRPSPAALVATLPAHLGTAGSSPDIYNIERGDNLWDICHRFFGDPFLWPKLWAMNQYITNPHLIFPGDQVRFYIGTTTQAPRLEIATRGATPPSEEVAQAAPETPPASEQIQPATDFKTEKLDLSDGPTYTGAVEVRNYAFVTPKIFNHVGYISHSGEEKYSLAVGDTVYMKFKDMAAIRVGDLFHVMQTIKTVNHPTGSKALGYLVHFKARVKVIEINKRVITGTIDDSWEISSRDDLLVPYNSLIHRIQPKESNKNIEGVLIEEADERYLISQRDVAFVNFGKRSGIEIGDTLRVVQQGDGIYGQKPGLPDVVIGQLTVFETFENLAIVFVNWSVKSLQAGDRVKTRL